MNARATCERPLIEKPWLPKTRFCKAEVAATALEHRKATSLAIRPLPATKRPGNSSNGTGRPSSCKTSKAASSEPWPVQPDHCLGLAGGPIDREPKGLGGE